MRYIEPPIRNTISIQTCKGDFIMQNIMLDIINNYGYLGIFLLIFIENVFPPIPSEAVLLFGGAITVNTAMTIPGTILAATAGSLAGAIILYALGRILQPERLKSLFAGRFGRVLHLKPEHVDQSVIWFSNYQNRAVFICRCIPIVRSLISIPAGFAKMNVPQFLLLTTLGSLIWNTVLVSLGAALGTAWETAMPYLDQYTHLVILALGIIAVIYILFTLSKKKKES